MSVAAHASLITAAKEIKTLRDRLDTCEAANAAIRLDCDEWKRRTEVLYRWIFKSWPRKILAKQDLPEITAWFEEE